MSQFVAYVNKNARTKKRFPYLIDIQSEILEELQTTVVIPLTEITDAQGQIIAKLFPVVEIDGKKYVAVTPQLAGINRNQLGKAVADLSEYRSQIIAAIDFMISGF